MFPSVVGRFVKWVDPVETISEVFMCDVAFIGKLTDPVASWWWRWICASRWLTFPLWRRILSLRVLVAGHLRVTLTVAKSLSPFQMTCD